MNVTTSSAENTDHEGVRFTDLVSSIHTTDNFFSQETFEDAPDAKEPSQNKANASEPPSKVQPASSSATSTPRASVSGPSLPPRPELKDEQGQQPPGEKLTQQTETLQQSAPTPAHRTSTSSVKPSKVVERQTESANEWPAKVEPSVDTPNSAIADDSTPVAKPPPLPSRFTGFSASLPWGSSAKPSTPSIPTPAPQTRKVTGPFAWLNRTPSAPKDGRASPLQASSSAMDRRNTSASISTIGSNPELMLKTLDDGGETNTPVGAKPPTRTTLRDRFKMLRMREEAGITGLDDSENKEGGAIAGLIGRTTSLGIGVGSPTSMADNKEGSQPSSPATSPRVSVPSLSVDSALQPGTVSGISAAASDAIEPIDWDFWQTVVNDGPQAVARTSPEELAQSIASGIPQTIRGVIWQVLASSKNEDLEAVYHDLLVNGVDKETDDTTSQEPAVQNGHINGIMHEKNSIASSASSMHSDHSTPATSSNVGVSSPTAPADKDSDTVAKAHAKLVAERQKKIKDDSASLQKLEKMIKRDMGSRTSYSKYAVAAGFQDGLFNVCKAYALFDEGVGYPQGMNFIIMPLLFTMPPEEAFCLLVRIMNKYGLRELFIQDMPGLHLHLYQFERLLEDLEPVLYCHLNRRAVTPRLYATQWFLTLFAYRFPLQLVLRVFDLALSEGLEAAILKIGMAVVQRNVATLMAMNDMAALTNFLKEKIFDVYIDHTPSHKSILESGFFGSSGGSDNEIYRADILVQEACAVKLTPEMLKTYRGEWTEKVRSEKEREAELENYRVTAATQVAKIRSLEERAEKSDTEHVQIATDLVRLKVENQELGDGNESLRGQVDELKKVVESEAATVETRLKGEMERVMLRNNEVQNENRIMEESMAEMEAQLVQTKMKYAEVSHAHTFCCPNTSLIIRWSDLLTL